MLKLTPIFPLASKGAGFSPGALSLSESLFGSGEEAGFWLLQGDEERRRQPACAAVQSLFLLPRPGVAAAVIGGDRREIKSTACGSGCGFTTSLYMRMLMLLLVTGQQQNQRGLCRAAFRETAKGAVKASDGKAIQDICPGQIPHQKLLPWEGRREDAKGGLPEARQRSCSLRERISFLAESSRRRHTGGGFVTRAAGGWTA